MTGHVRSRKIISGSLLEMTERWGFSVRSLLAAASGHHMTVEIERSVFEERGHVACIARPDTEVQRPINLTGVSGRPAFCAVRSPMALFMGALYLSPMASSSSLFWPFALT